MSGSEEYVSTARATAQVHRSPTADSCMAGVWPDLRATTYAQARPAPSIQSYTRNGIDKAFLVGGVCNGVYDSDDLTIAGGVPVRGAGLHTLHRRVRGIGLRLQ